MELVDCVICCFKPRICYTSWDDVMGTDCVTTEQLIRNDHIECTCGLTGKYYSDFCFERTEKKHEKFRSEEQV
jgi:hypothetical protein